ncbi:MAG: putative rRNA maturation factor [Thermoanaerobacteraceae bacterium]|jgi:probable rRNA maturation factor|nr:putative rRNA maturation factor [Thermoanaerobacteraceae bacterium]MDN5313216.1 putative rRNA maturation factor [Thermoanaerobacteraceae bacterium]RKL62752.1 rRNA maturation RNase YbeY [Thermoanaerobacteraceae bacterium SP2]
MPEIIISSWQGKIDISADLEQLLTDILKFALAREQVPQDAEVSVVLVDDAYIRELNRQYRAKDTHTDVLSFAMRESVPEEEAIEGDPGAEQLLGDIVISVERAREQAEEYGHSFERELGYLAVHGVLHLLGYDHEKEEDRKIMRQKEEEILKAFDLTRGAI